jgi:hypothetical protein
MPRNPYLAVANAPPLPRLMQDGSSTAPALNEDEEFPDFEAEEEDNAPPPVLAEATPAGHLPESLPRLPASQRPWAHVRPVGPARAVEPPHVPPPLAAAPELAPVRRPARIATGFAVGLAAGVGATSLIWVLGMTGAEPGGARTETVAAAPAPVTVSAPVTAPAPVSAPAPVAAPAVAQAVPVTVTTPEELFADPPIAATNLPGAGGLAALVADAPEVLKISAIASLTAMLLPPPPLAAAGPPDAAHSPITAPAPLPAALSAPPPQAPESVVEAAARLPEPLDRQVPGTATPAPDAALQDAPPGPITAPPALEPLAPAPEAEAAVAIAALPPHRVRVMAPTSIPEGDLASTLAQLSDDGFALEETDRVSYTVKANHVRYYHAQDRDVAQALAEGVDGEARDFTASDRDPPLGTIELFLQGRAPQSVRAAKPKQTQANRPARVRAPVPEAPREDPLIRELRDRIVRQLQRGDHL